MFISKEAKSNLCLGTNYAFSRLHLQDNNKESHFGGMDEGSATKIVLKGKTLTRLSASRPRLVASGFDNERYIDL